jgi:hypothetical protein
MLLRLRKLRSRPAAFVLLMHATVATNTE